MKNFRLWPMSALTLLAVGCLQADTLPVDPLIKFSTGGNGSTDIVCTFNGCPTVLSPVIGADGTATLDIFNASGKNIAELNFVIPTSNFDQDFTAITNAFENAAIFADEPDNLLNVVFSG